jgi:hypothetical protein
MNQQAFDRFKSYAHFSVRVDRYFNMVSVYGQHHESLRNLYDELPPAERLKEVLSAPDTADDIKRFLVVAAGRLSYIGTTNVFSNAVDEPEGEAWKDALNFAFYTCYCFQWTLFENFVKSIIQMALDAGAFNEEINDKLQRRWRQTKRFFDLLESGAVFGRTPFRTALPVLGWQPSIEDIDYSHLDSLREQRNDFIHGVESPDILSESLITKHQRYERSMWILRKFAENVLWEVQRALGHEIGRPVTTPNTGPTGPTGRQSPAQG